MIKYFRLIATICIPLIFISLVLLVIFPSIKKYPSKKEIMHLKNISELATAEYTVTKIVKFSDEKLWGDRKILFETTAVLKAGVELDNLQEEHITVVADSVSIFLPQPKLLSLDMKADMIKEKYNKTGILRSDFSNKEKDIILTAGEKSIRRDIDQTGIFKTSRLNTKLLFVSWLKLAGFNKVNIIFSEKAK